MTTYGCDEVALGHDGRHGLVRDSGTVTCHPLPEPGPEPPSAGAAAPR